MRRIIVICLLGISGAATTAHGQGAFLFNNYNYASPASTYSPVVYDDSVPNIGDTTVTRDDGVQIEIWWGEGTNLTDDNLVFGAVAAITSSYAGYTEPAEVFELPAGIGPGLWQPGETWTIQFRASGSILPADGLAVDTLQSRGAKFELSSFGDQATFPPRIPVPYDVPGFTVYSAGFIGANPPGQWVRILSTPWSLGGITCGDGTFLVVGGHAQTLTSTNSIDWNYRQVSTYYGFHGVTYADSKFMVVGSFPDFQFTSRGCFGVSSDAESWTIDYVDWSESFFTSVAYGNNIAVATFYPYLPQSGFAYSTNFVDWASVDFHGWHKVAFGGDQFVAVGDGGEILTSTNGSRWISAESGVSNFLGDVTYGSGMFVAVGEAGTILRSNDGDTWFQCVSPTSIGLSSVAFGGGVFLAAGHPASEVVSSIDGITWKSHATGIPEPSNGGFSYFTALAFGLGRFVGIVNYGSIYTSPVVQIELSYRDRADLNGVEVGFRGGLEGSYVLQSTTNLCDWTDELVFTNSTQTNILINTAVPDVSMRFLRAVAE